MPVIRWDVSWSGLFRQTPQRWRSGPMFFLIGLGFASLAIYAAAYLHEPFRPGRIQPYFWLFGIAFVFYMLATGFILRFRESSRWLLLAIFAFAILFNVALLPTMPSLSDDMYRYIWDGRVQGNGINPYRFP